MLGASVDCLQSLVRYIQPTANQNKPFPELDYLNFEGTAVYLPHHSAILGLYNSAIYLPYHSAIYWPYHGAIYLQADSVKYIETFSGNSKKVSSLLVF